MFELEDEKLGRLKVYNVTEARANFASVLREKEAKVVITWHGRPFKVLVDYQEYAEIQELRKLKAFSQAESPPLEVESNLNSNLNPIQGQWSESDLNQIVKSITEAFPSPK